MIFESLGEIKGIKAGFKFFYTKKRQKKSTFRLHCNNKSLEGAFTVTTISALLKTVLIKTSNFSFFILCKINDARFFSFYCAPEI